MKRVLWGIAIGADALAIVAASSFFLSEVPMSAIVWGVVLIGVFGALLLLLIKPQLLGHRASIAVASLSLAIPGVMILGSLDSWRISGQEAYAIVIGGLIGWLNWAAFRSQHGNVTPTAA